MALSIKDPETERLARTLAERTGESITIATRTALEERLRRVGSPARRLALLEDLARSGRASYLALLSLTYNAPAPP